METEIAAVKEQNAATDAYARGISQWIKENLGTKLELLDQRIADGIEARQKDSEASIWGIFSAKLADASAQFEAYREAMEAKHKELQEEVTKMREELKRSNSLRAKAEQSVKNLEETFARLTRERADEEAALFRKLTIKLEDERRAIEDERRKMADERKKYKYLLEKHKLEIEKSTVAAQATLYAPAATTAAPATFDEPVQAVATKPIVSPSPSVADLMKPQYYSVAQWLKAVGLDEHVSAFSSFGYESLHLVALLDEEDLNVMHITKPGHRKAILAAAADLKNARIVDPPSNENASSSTLADLTAPGASTSSTATTSATKAGNPNAKRPLPKLTRPVSGLDD